MHKARVGLIGYGRCGVDQFEAANSIVSETGLEIVTIAEKEKRHFSSNIPITHNHRDLFQNSEIDIISIATEPNTHYALAREAILANKHVIIDKPPTLKLEELDELEKLAHSHYTVMLTAYHATYRPEVELARQVLKDKNVVEVHIRYAEDVFFYHSPDKWTFDPVIAGGGVLIDSGINAISLVCYVLPDKRLTVTRAEFGQTENVRVETSAEVAFSFGNGTQGTLSMDWMHKGRETRSVTFVTDEGIEYEIDIVQGTFSRNNELEYGDESVIQEKVDQVSEYRGVYRHFAQCLENRESYIRKSELQFVLDAYAMSTTDQ